MVPDGEADRGPTGGGHILLYLLLWVLMLFEGTLLAAGRLAAALASAMRSCRSESFRTVMAPPPRTPKIWAKLRDAVLVPGGSRPGKVTVPVLRTPGGTA